MGGLGHICVLPDDNELKRGVQRDGRFAVVYALLHVGFVGVARVILGLAELVYA